MIPSKPLKTFLVNSSNSGDIFGGWLLSQMDIAGGLTAKQHARGRGGLAAMLDVRDIIGPDVTAL